MITVVNGKDRWLMAQEKVKACIEQAGGKLIDNMVFVHQGNEITALVSTLRWLWTGKKKGFWKIFPPAGVNEKEILRAERFGKPIVNALQTNEIISGKPLLKGMGAVKVNPKIIQQEKVGYNNFVVWAKMVKIFGNYGQLRRLPILFLFIVYLGLLILLSFPLTFIVTLFVNPFRKKILLKQIDYFEAPSGS